MSVSFLKEFVAFVPVALAGLGEQPCFIVGWKDSAKENLD
jgi:hypothetical protein